MKNFIKLSVISLFLVVSLAENTMASQLFAGGTMLHKMLERNLIDRNAKPPEKVDEPYIILMDKSLKVNFAYTTEKQMYVTAQNGLNVRADYNTKSAVISTVKYREPITIDGISTDKAWLHVKNGGYVSAEYLSAEQPPEHAERPVSDFNVADDNFTEEEPKTAETGTQDAGGGNLVSIGTFKITFYCNCEICGGHSSGLTYAGTYPQAGWTIAVDPSVIPLGSMVYINGNQYHAEDTGVYGNTIDVYMDSHQAALDRGAEYDEVYIER